MYMQSMQRQAYDCTHHHLLGNKASNECSGGPAHKQGQLDRKQIRSADSNAGICCYTRPYVLGMKGSNAMSVQLLMGGLERESA